MCTLTDTMIKVPEAEDPKTNQSNLTNPEIRQNDRGNQTKDQNKDQDRKTDPSHPEVRYLSTSEKFPRRWFQIQTIWFAMIA